MTSSIPTEYKVPRAIASDTSGVEADADDSMDGDPYPPCPSMAELSSSLATMSKPQKKSLLQIDIDGLREKIEKKEDMLLCMDGLKVRFFK